MSAEPSHPRRSSARWRIPLLLGLLLGTLLFYRWRLELRRGPLTYRIGTVDARFGMSREAFGEALGRAAALWNGALSRELFRESSGGVLEINLVYDYRQEAAERLKALSLRMDDTQEGFERLKAHFETLKGEAEQKGSSLERDFAAHNARVAAFNARSEAARRGGVGEELHRHLEAERLELDAGKAALLARQEELKELAENLKSLVVVLNNFALNHNLDLVDYRRTGDRLGPEFSEGEFVQEGGRRSITIYHFPSADGLVRVLAHELGHARGLGHLENPRAVMHPLLWTDVPELSPEDIQSMRVKAGSR